MPLPFSYLRVGFRGKQQGEPNFVPLPLPNQLPLFSSQSLWVFIPLGSQTFLWVLFILHPPDSLTIYVVCHLAALICEVLSFLVAGKKLNMSKQKPSLKLWEREKRRLYLGDFYGMMRCELLEHLFYFSMSRFASSSPFFSRGHMFPQVFIAKV